jgi:flagellar FliL protein
MAKDEDAPKEDGEAEAGEGAEGEAPKKGLSKKLLLIAGGGAALLVLLLGAGAWFFLFRAPPPKPEPPKMAGGVRLPLVPPQIVFFDMPDIVVNIQSAESTPVYLKLSVALELPSAAEKPALQSLMPRIVDQFQSYLRELRVDDLHGSAGVMRVKEELLRRINIAASPYPVRDVLLKEMIVQ